MPRTLRFLRCDVLVRVPGRRGGPAHHGLLSHSSQMPIRAARMPDEGSSSHHDDDRRFSGKLLENTAATIASVAMLALGGYSYHQYYKRLVLQKIENAFSPGFSTMELASLAQDGLLGNQLPAADRLFRVLRPEQPVIDAIVKGHTTGSYWLLFGEKGTGKTSMLLRSMREIHGGGVAMMEAHGDPEVFRVRLGKALDYEFHEDYIGGLFSIRGPRDSTALLDIERALNKLEKVAVRRQNVKTRPLVLIINNIHHIQDDPAGNHLLALLQQRAEMWAASRLITVVFTSDEYRTSEILKPNATRLQVMNVQDIGKNLAVQSLREYRQRIFGEEVPTATLDAIYGKVGGRLIFLDRIARSQDMLQAAESICAHERRWFLNKCWILGKELDPHVETQQDYCAAAMILARALVQIEQTSNSPDELPGIPLHKAHELMTRADFMQRLDQMNIFAIDSNGMVRADSMPMQNAFREVCMAEGFNTQLEETMERLDELEGLGRTTELTMKDLVENGEYEVVMTDPHGGNGQVFTIRRPE